MTSENKKIFQDQPVKNLSWQENNKAMTERAVSAFSLSNGKGTGAGKGKRIN